MHVCRECGLTSPTGGACHSDGTVMTIREDDPLVGATIGPYRIAQVIGIGGMGRVYKGVHPQIGSRVAIKVLAAELAHRVDVIDRFFAEARSVNLIRHESLVNILDLATLPDGRPYIVMEFLDGAPLSTVMRTTGPMPLGELARLMIEVLEALALAHERGIVHRDLKPDNLWVTPNGRAKVLDFGIAKLAPEQGGGMTHAGSLLGTPSYMSPEQALAREVDHRADLYALGVILYEAATGQRPFNAESVYALLHQQVEEQATPPQQLRPDLPDGYAQVIAIAMAKDPAQRFASAMAMANALSQVSANLPAAQWISVAPARVDASHPSGRSASSAPARTPASRPPGPPTPGGPSPGAVVVTATPRRRSLAPWIALGIAIAGGAVATAILLTRDGEKPGVQLPANVTIGRGVIAGGKALAPSGPLDEDGDGGGDGGGDNADMFAALAALGGGSASGSGSGSGAQSIADAIAEAQKTMADMDPASRKMMGELFGNANGGLGDLGKMFEGLGALGAAFGGSGAAAKAGATTAEAADDGLGETAGSAGATPAWVRLEPPSDPRRVDPDAEIQEAIAAARKTVPDAAPALISVTGLGPDGKLDLTVDARRAAAGASVGMITMMIASPTTTACVGYSLSPANASFFPADTCGAALPMPRCTLLAIRRRADATGARDLPLMITYSALGGPAQWTAQGTTVTTGGAAFMQSFPDDCAATP